MARQTSLTEERNPLDGSSIRRIVPDTQAQLRGRMNSKPSLETSVTYSDGWDILPCEFKGH